MWTRLLRPVRDDVGVADSVLKLTAIILLLRPFDIWWVAPIALAAACLSLIVRDVRRAPITWMFLAVLAAARIVLVWPLSDNHIYLLAYWCLAIGLSLSGPTPAATLAASSRWLLGAAFAMAVLWKAVLSVDYTDGRFFRVTLLTDERFADASMVFGGLTPDQMAQNRKFLEPLPEGAELLDPPAFIEPPRLRVFAAVATWGGLALESLIALLCLVPARRTTELARHVALLVFCATTYALAPVAGFGWLIATMGLAQVRPHQQTLRVAYITRVSADPLVLGNPLDWSPGGLDGPLNDTRPQDAAGIVTANRAPPWARLVTSMRPPCISTIERLIDRPTPRPSRLVEKNGSKIRGSAPSSTPGPASSTSRRTSPWSDRVATRTTGAGTT